MCGIIGYIGNNNASPILFKSLKRMEYRGYDSAGIATINNNELIVKKDIGRIDQINEKIKFDTMKGRIGIAHTRWATHGAVAIENSHPHISCNEEIALVHNGIIDNYKQLQEELSTKHNFKSETDTEVIVHLIEEEYAKRKEPIETLKYVSNKLTGSFALVVIFKDHVNEIYGVRKYAPLIIGKGKKENFIASDVISFIDHTDNVIFLEDKEITKVTTNAVKIINFEGKEIKREETHVAWEAADVSKEEFSHHTIKEIHEQNSTVSMALKQNKIVFNNFIKELTSGKNIFITGSGSSYHIALIFRNVLTRFARISAQAFLSSEADLI